MSQNNTKKPQAKGGKKAPVKQKKAEDEREQTFQAVVCFTANPLLGAAQEQC